MFIITLGCLQSHSVQIHWCYVENKYASNKKDQGEAWFFYDILHSLQVS